MPRSAAHRTRRSRRRAAMPSSSTATVDRRAPRVVQQPARHQRRTSRPTTTTKSPTWPAGARQLARVGLRGGRRPHGRRGASRRRSPAPSRCRRERDRGAARQLDPPVGGVPRGRRGARRRGVGVAVAAAIVVAAGVGAGAAPGWAPAWPGAPPRGTAEGAGSSGNDATAPPAAAWLSRPPGDDRGPAHASYSSGRRRSWWCRRSEILTFRPPPSSERPVISSGCSMPSSASAVGATSARMPSPSSESAPAVTMNGTGLSECAVSGEPSSSSISSALPWSAVTMHAPPVAVHRLDDPAEALVRRLHRLHRRRDHARVARPCPGWRS